MTTRRDVQQFGLTRRDVDIVPGTKISGVRTRLVGLVQTLIGVKVSDLVLVLHSVLENLTNELSGYLSDLELKTSDLDVRVGKNVVGPANAADNDVALFDGVSGKLIKTADAGRAFRFTAGGGLYIDIAGSTGGIQMTNAVSGETITDGFSLHSSTFDANVWNYESGNLFFATNNAERMTIDSSGNVGIGTVTPGSELDVNGDVAVNGSVLGFDQGITETSHGFSVGDFIGFDGANWVQASNAGTHAHGRVREAPDANTFKADFIPGVYTQASHGLTLGEHFLDTAGGTTTTMPGPGAAVQLVMVVFSTNDFVLFPGEAIR